MSTQQLVEKTKTTVGIKSKKSNPNREQQLHNLKESIRKKDSNNIENMIAIGSDLLQVKQLLKHGEFSPWIKDNFEMSHHSAMRYMNAARNLQDVSEKIKNMNQTAVYVLARIKDEKILQEIKSEIENGRVFRRDELEKLVKSHTAKKPSKRKAFNLKKLSKNIKTFCKSSQENLDDISKERLDEEQKKILTTAQNEMKSLLSKIESLLS